MGDTGHALRALAGHDLPGCSLHLPRTPLPPRAFARLRRGVVAHRLEGNLAAAVAAGALATTADQRREVADLHAGAAALAVRLDRSLLRASEVLEAAGVDHRVLKGVAAATVAYPDPALRTYRDVDLLVGADSVDLAVEVLCGAGYARDQTPLAPGFDRRFGKAVTLVAPDGIEIDLHRTLVMGPFGLRIDLRDLLEAPTSFRLAEREMHTFGAAASIVQACYSAALADVPPKLGALRDVAQLVLVRYQGHDDEALALADRWGGVAVVARAVDLTWDTLGLADATPLSEWARTYTPSRREKRDLAVYTGSGRYAPKALASLAAIPRWRDKVAFLRSVALPDRRFLAERGEGPMSWLRRGVAAVLPDGRSS